MAHHLEGSCSISVLKVQILLRSLTLLLRSIFLSEDGRKMGRWRCPARVTALLLCKGWQEGDAEREEEQLLLAGDVQVTFCQSCVWQFMIVGPAGCQPYNRFSPSSSSVFKPMINKEPHSGDFSIATHILYIAGNLRTLSIIP